MIKVVLMLCGLTTAASLAIIRSWYYAVVSHFPAASTGHYVVLFSLWALHRRLMEEGEKEEIEMTRWHTYYKKTTIAPLLNIKGQRRRSTETLRCSFFLIQD
jgi:hypothetical protein